MTPGESSLLDGVGNIVSEVLQPVEFHGFFERIFRAGGNLITSAAATMTLPMTLQFTAGNDHDEKKKHMFALLGVFFEQFCGHVARREQ